MPSIDPDDLQPRETYFLLTSLVVPRPIAWVSTLSEEGVANLAPHSYYNIISSHPPIVHFTSSGLKDTLRNVRATGEFVVNVVSRDLMAAMNTTAANFPPGEDEAARVGIDTVASDTVGPRRVAAARAALECRLREELVMGNGTMVFGDVLRVHVADEVWRDGRVAIDLLHPVGRLSGSGYTVVDEVVHLPRPSYDDLREDDLREAPGG